MKNNGLSLVAVEAHEHGFLNPYIKLLALDGKVIPGQEMIEYDAEKDQYGVRHVRVVFAVYDGE